LPWPKYESVARRHEFFTRVVGEVQSLPGVSRAAYITGLPMVVRGLIWVVTVPERADLPREQRVASLRFVTPGFFDALGIPLRRGRDVSDGDTRTSPYVAIVSQSFAERFWPGQDPIGRRFRVQGSDRTIVGVVGDIRWRGLERDSEPQLYLPSRQVADGAVIGHTPQTLVVKSSSSPGALVPAIRAIVARTDPQQPISDIQLLSDIVALETAPRRVQVRVLASFAAIAFLLAGLGLYGLLVHSVSQSTREIGVRLALGAERRTILAMVMQKGLQLAVMGIAVGTALAAAAGRMLQSLLAGISPMDLPTFGATLALVLAMTVLGSLLPALRAIRVDPLHVMRAE
jgi:predicted permease